MTSLQIDAASSDGAYVSGAYVVFFGTCLSVLTWMRRTDKLNYPLVLAALSMFILTTAIQSLSFSRVRQELSVSGQSGGSPKAYFPDPLVRQEVACVCILRTNLVLADLILVYRCYIVWDGKWKIVIGPIVLWVASAAVNTVLISKSIRLGAPIPVFVSSVTQCFTAVISTVLAQNIIVTMLIAMRIWLVTSVAENASGSLRPIIFVVLQSGLLYIATLVAFLITYAVGSNAQFIMLDLLNPMIGIAFTLLISVVGLGLTRTRDQLRGPSTTPPGIELHQLSYAARDVHITLPGPGEGDSSANTLQRVRSLTRGEQRKLAPLV